MKLTLVPKSPVKFRGETDLVDFDATLNQSTPIKFELGAQDVPGAATMGVCLDTSTLARNPRFQKCVLRYTDEGDTELAGQAKCLMNEAAAHAGSEIASRLLKPVVLTTLGILGGSLITSYFLRRR